MKQLQGKKIVLVNVVWGGPADGSMTWEHGDHMRELYPTLFSLSNFWEQKFSNWGRVVTPQFRIMLLMRLFMIIL